MNGSFPHRAVLTSLRTQTYTSFEMQLTVEWRFSGSHRNTFVAAVGSQDSRFYVIFQIGAEDDIFQMPFQVHIKNRRHNFDSSIKIASHPVSRSDVNVVVASVGKVEDPTMLKELAHDASHVDGLR